MRDFLEFIALSIYSITIVIVIFLFCTPPGWIILIITACRLAFGSHFWKG